MRRPPLVIALLAIALSAAACAPSVAPGWTYAPPTTPPASQPAASGDASAAPASPVTPAEPTPVPGGESPAAGAVQVSAVNIAFEQQAIGAPAGVPFVIHFANKDPGIPHNVEIRDASSMTMFKGEIITGPAQADYQVPALAAGTYTFLCSVHPNMTGTLTVGP